MIKLKIDVAKLKFQRVSIFRLISNNSSRDSKTNFAQLNVRTACPNRGPSAREKSIAVIENIVWSPIGGDTVFATVHWPRHFYNRTDARRESEAVVSRVIIRPVIKPARNCNSSPFTDGGETASFPFPFACSPKIRVRKHRSQTERERGRNSSQSRPRKVALHSVIYIYILRFSMLSNSVRFLVSPLSTHSFPLLSFALSDSEF